MMNEDTREQLAERVRALDAELGRLQAENRRLYSEKKEFMSIFDEIDAGIYVADPLTHEILYANKKLRRSKRAFEVVGQACFRVLQAREEPCDFCTNPILFGDESRGASHIWECQNRANGRWYHCMDKAIRWPDGRMVRYEIAVDIHTRKMAEVALQESEAQYSALVENAKDGVVILQDGVCRFANTEMAQISGYPIGELCGMPFADLVEEAFRAEVLRGVNAVLRGEEERRIHELRLRCKDGSVKDVEVTRAAIQYHGEPGTMSIVRDVTIRKNAMEALRVSEEKYRLLEDYLSENIPLHIGATDSNYQFIVWNRYSEGMLGYTAEEAIGRLTPKAIHEDEAEAEMVVRATEERGLFDGEVNFVHKDGTRIPVHLVVVPKTGSTGKMIGLYGYAEDITLRKLAENALRESEKRFRDLVECSLTGIFIAQDQRVVYCNPEQERLFGAINLPCALADYYRHVHPEDCAGIMQVHEQLTAGGHTTWETDIRYVSEEVVGPGEGLWFHCRGSLIQHNGNGAHLMNIMDITRTKKLEHLLRIEDKMASLGRVAAGMAHEIRSPLSGINVIFHNLAEAFQKRQEEDKSIRDMVAMFEAVRGATLRIETVVRRVLDFSRPANLQMRISYLNSAVLGARYLCSGTLRKEGVSVETDLTDDMPPCYIDVHMLENVFVNLITNAIESMTDLDRPKIITIRSGTKGSHVHVKVGDTGNGVPRALRDKVFDPYFTTKGHGSGIGLAICHRIVKDHGGALEVASSASGGAEFSVNIPAVRE